jgi:hypothetical protein
MPRDDVSAAATEVIIQWLLAGSKDTPNDLTRRDAATLIADLEAVGLSFCRVTMFPRETT